METNALSILESTSTELVTETMNRIRSFQQLIQKTLVVNQDYGVIPGTGTKPTLLKPGAEKINMLLKTTPEYEFLEKTLDFVKGFFNYELRCTLYHVLIQDGVMTKIPVSQGVGSCNSMEKKYRYVHVKENEIPAGIDKNTLPTRKNKGPYGEWLTYRIDNPDPYTLANVILKMAKKRAYVDATLQLAALSDIFTQDIEDMREFAQAQEAPLSPVGDARSPAPAPSNIPTTPQAPRASTPPAQASADPRRVIVTFGKFNGKTLAEVKAIEPSYITWLAANAKTPALRDAASAMAGIASAKPVQQEQEDDSGYQQAIPFPDDNEAPLPFDI